MNKIIIAFFLTLISLNSFADVDSQGPGMYCAPTAESAAKAIATINGATKSELASTSTESVDPREGTEYLVKIGKESYLVSTLGNDGQCSAELVQRK
jgi:hypothetical protein